MHLEWKIAKQKELTGANDTSACLIFIFFLRVHLSRDAQYWILQITDISLTLAVGLY